MSKEKNKCMKEQQGSSKKLVPIPRVTIPLDEYEFLRDVVDAARSVSDAYGWSNLRALHFAVARLETLLEKSSVLTERGAEELAKSWETVLDATSDPTPGKKRKEAVSTHNPNIPGDTPSGFPALRREMPTYTNPMRGTRVILDGVEIKALVGLRLTHRVDGVAILELELHPSEYRVTGAVAIVTEQVSEERTIEVHSYKDAEPTNPPSKDYKWRVVRADNYSRSGEAPGYDETWASDPSDYATASTYAKDLNDGSGLEYYYRVVREDYKLAVFTP